MKCLEHFADLIAIEDQLHDAVVVPVSVNYERMPSTIIPLAASFSSSSSSSLFSLAWSGCWLLLRHFVASTIGCFSCCLLLHSNHRHHHCRALGKVRLNLSQPYSLREFCQKMSSKRRLDEQQRLDSRGNNQNEDEYDDNNDDDDDDDNHNAAAAITEINYDKQHASFHLRQHIQYDVFKSASVMCTSLVAFIVSICKPKGCNLDEMCDEFANVKRFLSANETQLGFSCHSSRQAVLYALELIDDLLVVEKSTNTTTNNNSNEQDLFIRPNLSRREELLTLAIYSSPLSRVYFLHSVIAHALRCSMTFDLIHSCANHQQHEPPRQQQQQQQQQQPTLLSKRVLVAENNLMYAATRLVRIFQHAFVGYKKPCESVTESLVRTLSQFVGENLLASSTFNSLSLLTSSINDNNQAVPTTSNGSGGDDDWDDEPFRVEKPIGDDEFLGVESLQRLDPDTREIYLWKPYFSSKSYQVNLNTKNFKIISSYSCLLTPFIEAYFNFFYNLRSLLLFQNEQEQEKEEATTSTSYSEEEIICFVSGRIQMQIKSASSINNVMSTSLSLLQSALDYCLDENVNILQRPRSKIDSRQQQSGRRLQFTRFSRQLLDEHCIFLKKFL